MPPPHVQPCNPKRAPSSPCLLCATPNKTQQRRRTIKIVKGRGGNKWQMEKRNENENRNRNQNPNRNSNKEKGRMAEKQKLKLISRHANINFKFAKRMQDNQQWGPRPGSTTASICPTVRHTSVHSMSWSWSWRRSRSRRRVATRVLQLISHRFLASLCLLLFVRAGHASNEVLIVQQQG